MASPTTMNLLNTVLQTMDTSSLACLLDQIEDIRKDWPCKLLEIPAELRNTIYRMAITPKMIEAHIRRGKPPNLITVSRQISEELRSLYYNHENIQVVLYHGPQEGWKPLLDSLAIQALVARWSCSSVECCRKPCDTSEIKLEVEGTHSSTTSTLQSISEGLRKRANGSWGILTFSGLPQSMGLLCCYDSRSTEYWDKKREGQWRWKRLGQRLDDGTSWFAD